MAELNHFIYLLKSNNVSMLATSSIEKKINDPITNDALNLAILPIEKKNNYFNRNIKVSIAKFFLRKKIKSKKLYLNIKTRPRQFFY